MKIFKSKNRVNENLNSSKQINSTRKVDTSKRLMPKVYNKIKSFSLKKKGNTAERKYNTNSSDIKRVSFIRVFLVITLSVLAISSMYMLCNAGVQKANDVMKFFTSKAKNMQEDVTINSLKKGEKVEISNIALSQAEILAKLSKITVLPNEEVSMLVRVKDAEVFKAKSDMYKDVKTGDYIVVFPSVAYIYDLSQDKIIKTLTLN